MKISFRRGGGILVLSLSLRNQGFFLILNPRFNRKPEQFLRQTESFGLPGHVWSTQHLTQTIKLWTHQRCFFKATRHQLTTILKEFCVKAILRWKYFPVFFRNNFEEGSRQNGGIQRTKTGFAMVFSPKCGFIPGANPTIASYNASAVKKFLQRHE
jgi:hypothetical protein